MATLREQGDRAAAISPPCQSVPTSASLGIFVIK